MLGGTRQETLEGTSPGPLPRCYGNGARAWEIFPPHKASLEGMESPAAPNSLTTSGVTAVERDRRGFPPCWTRLGHSWCRSELFGLVLRECRDQTRKDAPLSSEMHPSKSAPPVYSQRPGSLGLFAMSTWVPLRKPEPALAASLHLPERQRSARLSSTKAPAPFMAGRLLVRYGDRP